MLWSEKFFKHKLQQDEGHSAEEFNANEIVPVKYTMAYTLNDQQIIILQDYLLLSLYNFMRFYSMKYEIFNTLQGFIVSLHSNSFIPILSVWNIQMWELSIGHVGEPRTITGQSN